MAKLSKKQKKKLQAARKDGKITRREAKSLQSLGISNKKIDNTKKGTVSHSKYATKVLSKPQPKPSSAPKPSKPGSPVSVDGKSWSYRDPGNINSRNTTGSSSGRGGAATNRNANPAFSELYKFSQGQVELAARAEGIKNINNPDEVKRILNRLGAGIGTGNKGGKNNSDKADRGSGEYDDIVAAQGEDQAAGNQAANDLKNADVNIGGISPEVQAQLDALTLANSILTTLDRFGVKATFLMVGHQAEARPSQVRKVASRGHAIGSHTYSHPNLGTVIGCLNSFLDAALGLSSNLNVLSFWSTTTSYKNEACA